MRRLLVPMSTTSALTLIAVVMAHPRDADAFFEDLCYAPGGGPLASCSPLPEVCRPAGTDTAACKAAIIAVTARRRNASDGGRSSVHTDVTYLLAQAVGFSATDAHWIAAYDESTDLGSFTPRANQSMPIGDGALTTASISGFVRTDRNSGGSLLHVIAPYNHGLDRPVPGIDGLHPDPTNAATELTLANFRAWALAGSSASKPACTAGITIRSAAGDYATGAACYATGTSISGSV